MGALRLKDTMTAIADALVEAAVVEKAWAWPKWGADRGEAVVDYPERVDFDQTMGRGSDLATFPVYLLAGLRDEEDTVEVVDGYLTAVKTALESGEYGGLADVVSSVTVPNVALVPLVLEGPLRYVLLAFDVEVLS